MRDVEEQLRTIRISILNTGLALLDKGLVAGTWGNISARVPERDWVLVTPSGRNYRTLKETEIVLVDAAGSTIQGDLPPSSELPLHLAVYKARSDVQAIVHTHSIYASSCAVAGKNIPPIIEDLVQIVGGGVTVAEYGFPGTVALADHAVVGLADKQAVLLANHGMIGCGETLAEAMLVCELVEKAAAIYIFAQQLGGARELAAEDVHAMRRFYLEQYRLRQGG